MEQSPGQQLGQALELAGIEVPRELFERLMRAYVLLRADLDALYAQAESGGPEETRS